MRSSTSRRRSRWISGTNGPSGHRAAAASAGPAPARRESPGRDQADARDLALEHGVGRRRRAVHDGVDAPGSTPAASSAASTPKAWFSTVVGTLASRTSPVASSSRTRSVKVPPTSMPAIRLMASAGLSFLHRDDVRLDLAVDGAGAETPGDRRRCDVGGFVEPRRVARLDLAAQRRALAVRDRRRCAPSRPAAGGTVSITALRDEAAAADRARSGARSW